MIKATLFPSPKRWTAASINFLTQDELRRRVDEAAQYVPLEQLCLSPQCGFSSTVEGNAITEEQQWAKLRLVVRTAEAIWG